MKHCVLLCLVALTLFMGIGCICFERRVGEEVIDKTALVVDKDYAPATYGYSAVYTLSLDDGSVLPLNAEFYDSPDPPASILIGHRYHLVAILTVINIYRLTELTEVQQ